MDITSPINQRHAAHWLSPESGTLDAFKLSLAKAETNWPLAADVQKTVPVYAGATVRAAAPNPKARRDLMSEWAEAFTNGPGIIVLKNAVDDLSAIDQATAVFNQIIQDEKAQGAGAGDHFAKPGSNDRVWNAAEKHCRADPANFIAYYASDAIAMASEAWLGRGYQVTAQVNRVNPGGTAQKPHRDYHLGFMSPDQMSAFPAHIHRISPVLTLQGAVAHCDMPLESGPTLFLPGSQRFFEGYLAFGRPEFQTYFAENHIQLPLEKGDAVFFNPAVMHGAGHNRTTDIFRMANLLQISSGFGRAMESMDRLAMSCDIYPALQAANLPAHHRANVIAACAEGYAFPTNLDRDPPVGGLAPQTQADLMATLLDDNTAPEAAIARLSAHWARRAP